MSGVSLVGAELLFFALMFYVFFIREPVEKPYKIRGNPWGNYGPSPGDVKRARGSWHRHFIIQ
jgi:hypothetical protein